MYTQVQINYVKKDIAASEIIISHGASNPCDLLDAKCVHFVNSQR